MRYLFIFLVAVAISTAPVSAAPDPKDVVKKCVERHGGEENFKEVRTVYAEMEICTYSEKVEAEATFKEYYRKPDKLRIEIIPKIDPPTKISWDGKQAWQLAKDTLEETDDPKIVERLQEGLKFLNLMLLTNLFEDGSKLEYVKYIEEAGIHVITRIDSEGKQLRIYINSDYLLVGADFYWSGTEDLLVVKFYEHQKKGNGLYLPTFTELYKKPAGKPKQELPSMTASLRVVKINALRNGNSFFTNLNEQARLKSR